MQIDETPAFHRSQPQPGASMYSPRLFAKSSTGFTRRAAEQRRSTSRSATSRLMVSWPALELLLGDRRCRARLAA